MSRFLTRAGEYSMVKEPFRRSDDALLRLEDGWRPGADGALVWFVDALASEPPAAAWLSPEWHWLADRRSVYQPPSMMQQRPR